MDATSAAPPLGNNFLGSISSAEPVLALLNDHTEQSRELGLRQLNAIIDTFWPEIADSLPFVQKIYEDPKCTSRQLAALVISKVHYHLGDYPNALVYALNAGDHFDLNEASEFTNIIIAKAVSEYIKIRQESQSERSPRENGGIGTRAYGPLENMVERLIAASVAAGDEKHAIGIALDSRRLDIIVRILKESPDCSGLLDYTMGLVDGVVNRQFSSLLYENLQNIMLALPKAMFEEQYANIVTCLYRLNNHEQMGQMLRGMIDNDDYIRVYQICYDLVDIGDQKFIKALNDSPVLNAEGNTVIDRVKHILSGISTTQLHLQFLHRANHTDLQLLEDYMNNVDQRNSILHNAIVMSHAIMQAGTCCDVFLRDNLSWFGKANNWAKFTATASIGVIHKGYVSNYKKVLSAYLPTESTNSGHSYSEGGALYALGLVLSNHYDAEAKDLLLNHLRNDAADEPLQHGAALGLGLLCMGQDDMQIYESLKNLLFRNNAVSGQAAAIAIGLLMLGSANLEVQEDLYAFAFDTQHEKIVRACVLAIGMILYRRENDADDMISKLCKDNDPVIRYGGMFACAMAYCGTGSCKAMKELLYASVSDVSDDVRRAAVISLGFVLCNTPDEVPKVLKLLVASYNPHVRYGAAIALGISCAAHAHPDVVRLLHSLSSDRSDFVRQGAFIALGLVLQQSNAETSNDVMQVRELFKSVATEKHQDVMAKFGAIIGAGLMDAGGQNCVASLYSCRGNMRQEAVVGFLIFSQHWYWHSFMHFVCLTFQPTCLIAINKDLKIPTGYKVLCTAPPKMFDYIPHASTEVQEAKKEEASAVLSISAKRSAWLTTQKPNDTAVEPDSKNEKTAAQDDAGSVISDGKSQRMEISSIAATMGYSSRASNEGSSVDYSTDVVMASDGCSVDSNSELLNAAVLDEIGETNVDQLMAGAKLLQNPCKLVPKQAMYCVVPRNDRYSPIFPGRKYGIVLLQDNTPNEPEEYIACEEEQQDAPPFTPFEYKDN